MKHLAIATVALLVLALSACSSRGAYRERINPPTISIQELRFEDGGQCRLRLRIQNHSTVVMHYASLHFSRLDIDGHALAPKTVETSLDIPPFSGEPFDVALDCAGLPGNASELMYQLEGTAQAEEPRNRRFPFRFRSRLLPVPGLDGVYR